MIQNLEEMGIFETFTSGEFKKIKHYTISYDKLNGVTAENFNQTEKLPENQVSHSSVQVGQVDLSNMDSVYIDTETTSPEKLITLFKKRIRTLNILKHRSLLLEDRF